LESDPTHFSADPDEEGRLIQNARNGDLKAFEQLVERYQHRIHRFCFMMVRGRKQDAEDLTQEVFIKAYKGLKRFQPKARFYTWLYRIAVNTCIDHQRSPFWKRLVEKRVQQEGQIFGLNRPSQTPEQQLERKEIADRITEALRQLSPKLSSAFLLKEREGFSYQEISEVLEVSVGTVKSRVFRGRTELSKLLSDLKELN
jgi:RNA polymerase sigma-70 factor (ECF subfamily)